MSEWTVDTLKEYVDTRFSATKDAISKADTVAEARATKIEVETKGKFEGTNEWRATVTDLIGKMMPRAEFDSAMKSMDEKIRGKNVLITISTAGAVVAMLVTVFNFASNLHG